MKKTILLLFLFGLLGLNQLSAQVADKNPITTAHLVAADGRIELVFDLPVAEYFTVDIRDLTGKLMYSLKSDNREENCSSVMLPIETLRRGIYLVQVVGASGKTATLKLQRN